MAQLLESARKKEYYYAKLSEKCILVGQHREKQLSAKVSQEREGTIGESPSFHMHMQ